MPRSEEPKPRSLTDELVVQLLGSGNPQAALQQLIAQLAARAGAGGQASPFAPRDQPIALPEPPAVPALVTVKVGLDGARPPIWRRLQLRGDLTLDLVHEYVQIAMGWTDSHLHRFEPGPVKDRWRAPYFLTQFDLDEGESGTVEDDVRLDQVLRSPGDRLFYTYDFGDDWAHTLTAETVREATDDDPPALLLKMVRACPPEDVGGMYIWNELAAALRANPDPAALTGDFEQYAGWLPEGFDPDEVDLDGTNGLLDLVGDGLDSIGSASSRGSSRMGRRAALPDLTGLHPWVAAVFERAPADLVVRLTSVVELATAPAHEEVPTDELEILLRPWLTLLDAAGTDGIALTKAGWMVPEACERLWHEGGLDWGYGKGNREQHTPELSRLRELATRARLIRKHRDRLVLTPLGRRAATDREVLIDALAAGLLTAKEPVGQNAQAIAVMLVASGFEPERRTDGATSGRTTGSDFNAEVARILTSMGWRQDNAPVVYYYVDGLSDVSRILTPQLGNGPRDPAPTSAAARHLARKALRTNG